MFKKQWLTASLFLSCVSVAALGAEQSPTSTEGKTDLSSEGFGLSNAASARAPSRQDEKKSEAVDSNDQKSINVTSEGFGPNRPGNTSPAMKNIEAQKDTGDKTGVQSEGFGPNIISSNNTASQSTQKAPALDSDPTK